MKYTQLGRTGLKVSRLVLGTMNFGPQTDEADSHAIMDAALDAGINYFDTANVYGWGENKGRTEEIIGTWFAKGEGRRDKVVLATKVYGNMAGDGPSWPNHDKLSAVNIRRAVDASLKRLQTDYIDVYQFHHIDRSTPFEEIWQAIDVLVQQGKILYAGSSNFPGYKIAQANEIAARRGGTIGLVSEQCLYNLAERRAEMEVIPAAQEYGLGVIPWSPLQGGLLGGVIKKEVAGGRRAPAGGPRTPSPTPPHAPRSRRGDVDGHPEHPDEATGWRTATGRGRRWPLAAHPKATAAAISTGPGDAAPGRQQGRASSSTPPCGRSSWRLSEELLTAPGGDLPPAVSGGLRLVGGGPRGCRPAVAGNYLPTSRRHRDHDRGIGGQAGRPASAGPPAADPWRAGHARRRAGHVPASAAGRRWARRRTGRSRGTRSRCRRR
ncbi:hypothetical protein SALBM311S_10229 [Streptomyces alboniger]